MYLYIIYLHPYTHPRCISTTRSSYSYRRNWIWSSNFPFLRWRSAFAATGEFRFRLLPFVWVLQDEISGPIFFFFHFRRKHLTKSCRGIPWVVQTPIPRASGVPNMMPTASSTYWRLALHSVQDGFLTRLLGIWNFWTHQGSRGCKDFDSSVFGGFWLKNEVFGWWFLPWNWRDFKKLPKEL